MTEHIQPRFTHSLTGQLLAEALLCARPWDGSSDQAAGGWSAGGAFAAHARHVSPIKAGIVCEEEKTISPVQCVLCLVWGPVCPPPTAQCCSQGLGTKDRLTCGRPLPAPAGWVTWGRALLGTAGEAREPQRRGISPLLAQQGGLSGRGSRETMG